MTNLQHVIHDTDRDGFGSAAMLAAELGPEHCRLYPSPSKNGSALVRKIDSRPGDTVWVLDIPTPERWSGFPRLDGVQINWVDHHPVRAADSPPEHIKFYLPVDDRPVTTMHLLVQHWLVTSLHEPMAFVRSLCVPKFETVWTRIFDGLAARWQDLEDGQLTLADLISRAPLGERPTAQLRKLEAHVIAQRQSVDAILDRAEVSLSPRTVVVRLENVLGQPLKHFSLRAQERFNRPVSVIVHRNQMLYCGRKTRGGPDIDFLTHFAGRTLQAKGHPYVAFVDVPESRIEEELAVLLEAVTATGMLDEENEDTRLQREHLEKVIGWAERIERDLHELIWHYDLPVFFRPGASGVAMVGLTSDLPQRGRSGYTNLKKLNENFESLFLTHCITAKQGRPTPEKQLQSYLIRSAVSGSVERWLTPLNEASEKTDAPVKLRFAVDEIPLPYRGAKLVCDILAVRETPEGHIPVVIELKSRREMKRLVEQVTDYTALVDSHANLYERLFGVILHDEFKFSGPCEKWIVWPTAGKERDPREDELAAQGIRVVEYEPDGLAFRFRVGRTPRVSACL